MQYLDGNILQYGPYLEIQVQQTNHRTEGLRKLMIGTIAGTLQKSTEDAKNCWDFTYGFPLPHRGRHCFVGHVVGVTAGDSYLTVGIRSRGDEGGKFDCPAILEQTNRYLDELMPEYERELGGGRVERDVFCLQKPKLAEV